ncbi:MAG: hypothetical protein IJF67_03925, partial [Clostridia bacterium]|nr:hypothetical protein [Clostridia bacterium]
MRTRISSMILLMSMLAAMPSCGGEASTGATGTDEQGETAAPVETADPDSRAGAVDSLPSDLDFGGKTLRIFTRGGDTEVLGEFVAEEANGEIINDAVFARNMSVQDRLNIKFDIKTSESNRHAGDQDHIRQVIMSGSDDYDLIANQLSYTVALSIEGLFTNLAALPYLDFDKPWWNSDFMEMTAYKGHNYVCMGELSQTMISGTYAMFFNRTMFEEFYKDEPSLYETVRAGDWTLDKMMTYTSGIYSDVNGNATADEGDRFGHYFKNDRFLGADSYVGGCNVQILTYDESSDLVYHGTGDTVLTFVEKLHKLIFNDNNTLRGTYNDDTVMMP